MTDTFAVLTNNFILNHDVFPNDFLYDCCLSAILNHSLEAIVLLNQDFLCIGCNYQFLNLLNYHSPHINNEQILKQLYQSQSSFFSELSNQLHLTDEFNNIKFSLNKENEQIFVNASACSCQNHCGKKIYFVYLSTLYHVEKSVNPPLQQDNMLNKDTFFAFAHHFLENLHHSQYDCLALIRLHINKLHTFNASIGRNATDVLIAHFATRLQTCEILQGEILAIAHLGGGDFSVFLNLPSQLALENYLTQLYDLSHQAFLIQQSHLYVNFSIGVALYQPPVCSFDSLLNHAEKALKQALFLGSNTCIWFDELEKSPIFSNVHLSSAFTHALRESQVIAYFQPKVACQPQSFAFEALVRWQHPILGLLSPKDFLDEVLDISSQSLFESVVNYCLEQIDNWKQQGFLVKIAVNVDVRQLWHQNFLPFIQSCLVTYPNFCEQIEFEITETAQIQHHEKTIKILQKLHNFGIKLAIDDFGTGFASLSYLLDYPVDKIKLDKIFIENILHNPRHLLLVKSLIALAHQLNLEVIAEGVETDEQFALLKNIGCDITQGYLHGKPMSADDVSIWLKNMTL